MSKKPKYLSNFFIRSVSPNKLLWYLLCPPLLLHLCLFILFWESHNTERGRDIFKNEMETFRNCENIWKYLKIFEEIFDKLWKQYQTVLIPWDYLQLQISRLYNHGQWLFQDVVFIKDQTQIDLNLTIFSYYFRYFLKLTVSAVYNPYFKPIYLNPILITSLSLQKWI